MSATMTRPTTAAAKAEVPVSALPRIHKGPLIDVATLSLADRRRLGLATPDTITHVTTDAGLRDILAYARRKGGITVDFETDQKDGGHPDDGLNPWRGQIVLMQFGDRERQFIVWAQSITDWSPLVELFADETLVKKGVNLKFDIRWWLVTRGQEHRWWNVVDAMLVEQVIGCGLFAEGDDGVGFTLKMTGMEKMAERWLGLDLPKSTALRTGWAQYTPETIPQEKLLYAADDVVVVDMLLAKQGPWVRRLGLTATVNLEHAFLPVLADKEVRGIRLNMEKWGALADEATRQVVEAKRALDRLFDVTMTVEVMEDETCTFSRDKNYASNGQLVDLIRDYMRTHHGVEVIACNQHFKEALVANGFNPLRAEKLFAETKVPTGKLTPSGKEATKKVGSPYMLDHTLALWEDYHHYLPKGAFLLPDTTSPTLKLSKITAMAVTEGKVLDPTLPARNGLPPALVDPILASRKYAKQAGTYGRNWEKYIEPATGRLHVDTKQAALATGRTSTEPNIQNPPGSQAYRDPFEADTRDTAFGGSVFIGADWDQIEPRIIGQLSDCFLYKQVFFSKHPERPEFEVYCKGLKEALDLYTEIGKRIGVIPQWMTVEHTKGGNGVEPTKEGKAGRKQAKIVVLGLGYGTGEATFFIRLIVDLGEVQDRDFSNMLHRNFWLAVPEVKRTLDDLSNLAYPGDEVRRNGKVTRKKSPRRIWHPLVEGEVTWAETLGGRKRFYKATAKSWFTTGRNQPVQGTGADILKRAMVIWQRWCWKTLPAKYGFVNDIHDEVIAEVPRAHPNATAEEAYAKLCEVMRKVGEMYCPNVPITSAGYIGTHWIKD